MKESSLLQESDKPTPDPKLFGLPRPFIGAVIGLLFFLGLFFIFNTWATKTTLLMASLLAPGFLTMMILTNSVISLSPIGYTIIFFLTSSIPLMMIGSLIISKKSQNRSNGIILLVVYLLSSIGLGFLVLLAASIYN